MERIASFVLWLERVREDTDWDGVALNTITFVLTELILSLFALLEIGIRYGDPGNVAISVAGPIWLRWVVAGLLGILWVRLRIWSRIVRWARVPKRVEERLRDAQ